MPGKPFAFVRRNMKKERVGTMTSRTVYVGSNAADIAMIRAQFVQKACEFKSHVMIEIDQKKFVNGKSLMGMLALDVSQGASLHIMSEGSDEEQAAEILGNLLNR